MWGKRVKARGNEDGAKCKGRNANFEQEVKSEVRTAGTASKVK